MSANCDGEGKMRWVMDGAITGSGDNENMLTSDQSGKILVSKLIIDSFSIPWLGHVIITRAGWTLDVGLYVQIEFVVCGQISPVHSWLAQKLCGEWKLIPAQTDRAFNNCQEPWTCWRSDDIAKYINCRGYCRARCLFSDFYAFIVFEILGQSSSCHAEILRNG